jgi:hypothetical protein
MHFILKPWHIGFAVWCGCVNRQQQDVIQYLQVENRVLRQKLGSQRILLNPNFNTIRNRTSAEIHCS